MGRRRYSGPEEGGLRGDVAGDVKAAASAASYQNGGDISGPHAPKCFSELPYVIIYNGDIARRRRRRRRRAIDVSEKK